MFAAKQKANLIRTWIKGQLPNLAKITATNKKLYEKMLHYLLAGAGIMNVRYFVTEQLFMRKEYTAMTEI
jgi:hypothetical protein